MDSPPKLKRLMIPVGVPLINDVICSSQPQLTKVQATPVKIDPSGMEDFEGTLVDSAVSDIPGVFTEVFKAQKSHADEMSRRKQTLAQLQVVKAKIRLHICAGRSNVQDDLKESLKPKLEYSWFGITKEKLDQVEEAKEECKSEILSVMNRIFMAKESVKGKGKLLKEIDADLKKLVVDIADKETEIEALNDDIDFGNRNHILKLKQFQEFVQEVEEHENQSPVGQQILDVKEKIQSLQEQEEILNKDLDEKENILSGKSKAMMSEEMDQLQIQIETSKQKKEHIEEKVNQEKEKQAKIVQDTQVLGKKHTAQMTRQKLQLREILMRNKQRQLHVSQLESNIARAKRDLET